MNLTIALYPINGTWDTMMMFIKNSVISLFYWPYQV